jgi:GT2 family glycosyltransferase
VAKTLNAGIARAKGELILFLGNDCEPEPNFLILAARRFQKEFADGCGLVALNDGTWDGKLATHWLASRSLLKLLPGEEFFHSGYKHVGCDNELTARCRALGKYAYCADAKVIHRTIFDEVHALAWNAEAVEQDRQLLAERLLQAGLKE